MFWNDLAFLLKQKVKHGESITRGTSNLDKYLVIEVWGLNKDKFVHKNVMELGLIVWNGSK